jgi:hypothetical protein
MLATRSKIHYPSSSNKDPLDSHPSPLEKFLDSDLIHVLIVMLGFRESLLKLSLLNKMSYDKVLAEYLMFRVAPVRKKGSVGGKKRSVATSAATSSILPAEVDNARPIHESAARICYLLDTARFMAMNLNLVPDFTEEVKETVNTFGHVQVLRQPGNRCYINELARLTAAAYTYWHSLPSDPKHGLFDLVRERLGEDSMFSTALATDCPYWQSSRVYDTFIVLFDRIDGTVIVSKDLQRVYLVLGQAQSLGEVANHVWRNGGFIDRPKYKPPKFHGPLIGTGMVVTLLNWEGKIVYDGIFAPAFTPSQSTLHKAIQAYLYAVNTKTLITSLEKKPIQLPNFERFASKQEYQTVYNQVRPCLDQMQMMPFTTVEAGSHWILRRLGCTEEQNPKHNIAFGMIGPRPMQLLTQATSLVPTLLDLFQFIYLAVHRLGVRPISVGIDVDVHYEKLRLLLEPSLGIKVKFMAPASFEETFIELETNPLAGKEKLRCPVCQVDRCDDGSALLTCSKCHDEHYCSREHQLQHWKIHKKSCGVQQHDA